MRKKSNGGVAPTAYRAGVVYFCEMPFFVNKSVLIPRFDTEKLVETVILNTKESILDEETGVMRPTTALDICTGSGCIAVILSQHGYAVTATDISRGAIRTARKNAKLNTQKIEFFKCDLFPSCRGKNKALPKFDIIVSNPPYIKTAEVGAFDKSTLFEPRIALDGGADGLGFYRRIVARVPQLLNENGKIFFEIDHRAGECVKNILQSGGFRDIKIVKDARGLDRVIYGTK
jgi:release factor glutamine methyltransferase